MKTAIDYYSVIFLAFVDAITAGCAVAADMAVLSAIMLYEGGW